MTEGLAVDVLGRLGRGDRLDEIARDEGTTREALLDGWRAEHDGASPTTRASDAYALAGGRSPSRSSATTARCHTSSLPRTTTCSSATATPRPRTGCSRWTCAGAARTAAWRRCWVRMASKPDVLARTVDLPGLARAELDRLAPETRALLDAFAAGVNALAEQTADRPPIEFDLLGYRPEPWTALDCGRLRRFLALAAHRPAVGDQHPRVRRADPRPGAGRAHSSGTRASPTTCRSSSRGRTPTHRVGAWPTVREAAVGRGGPRPGVSGPADGGSNNWAVAGSRTASGGAMVASDPHMPYESASSFYEVHLSGGSFDVAGAGFVGLPGLTFGRTRTLAWGITNNICSLRDLYVERAPDAVIGERERDDPGGAAATRHDHRAADAARPDRRSDPAVRRRARRPGLPALGRPARLRLDRGAAPARPRRVRSRRRSRRSRAGSHRRSASSSARRAAASRTTRRARCRSASARSAATATAPTPTTSGPGLIPPDGMPHVVDPARGWIATANNRPAPEDFPYPLSGHVGRGPPSTARRRAGPRRSASHDRESFGRIHGDVLSGPGAATTATTWSRRCADGCRPRTSRRSRSWPPGTRGRRPTQPAPRSGRSCSRAGSRPQRPNDCRPRRPITSRASCPVSRATCSRATKRAGSPPTSAGSRRSPRRSMPPSTSFEPSSAPTRRAGAGATSTNGRRAIR